MVAKNGKIWIAGATDFLGYMENCRYFAKNVWHE